MTIFTKIKTGQFQNIPPSKRWLIPHILQRILLTSVDHRRESGVTRDGRRNFKYPMRPAQGLRERLRRLRQADTFIVPRVSGLSALVEATS